MPNQTDVLAVALWLATSTLVAQSGTVAITHQATSTWSTGFSGQITITNQASYTIHDWRLSFDAGYTITSLWNGQLAAQNGGHHAITAVQASWEDGDLSPNEVATIDFVATGMPNLPANGFLNGVPVTLQGQSPAPPPLVPRPAPAWPERVFAPYVDATAWPPFDLVGTAQAHGVRFYNLGFVVARSNVDPTPSWGGYHDVATGYLLPEIHALRALRGDVMVSFGGAAGTELAAAATSVAQLQAAYQAVIDQYALTHVDFDIEGVWLAHPASLLRRAQAIAGLQAAAAAAGRELHVWFTLPVLPTGLTLDGVNAVTQALQQGVRLDGVNVMAMDYGDIAAPNPAGNMGNYAVQAATATQAQLAAIYAGVNQPQTQAQLWRKLGVTPMIGVNDVATEVFQLSDAAVVLAFGLQRQVGLLSFWSMTRDLPCPNGPQPWASPSCSSIAQPPYAFTAAFLPFTGPTWRDLGFGLAGANGVPMLQGGGDLQAGGAMVLQLANALPGAPVVFGLGATRLDLPVLGFTLVPEPILLGFASADPAGAAGWTIGWPALPRRAEAFLQAVVLDPAAAQGIAASNALYAIAP